MRLPRLPLRVAAVPAVAALALLAACAAVIDAPLAHAAAPGAWPPAWQDPPASLQTYGTPRFDAPQASHCHRLPSTREVPGGGQYGNSGRGDRTRELRSDEPARAALEDRASRRAEVAKSAAPSAMPAAPADAAERESDLAAPAAQNAATADMATRARESAERRDLAAAKSAAPAGAVAPQQAEAAAPSALAGRAAAASTALETPGFSNLRFEIRRKPEAWTWTRDDGAPRPMDEATEAWIAQTDRSARTVWQAGAVGADQSTTTLRFTRDGVVRAVLRLGPTGMRLTRGGKTESAELSRGQAAALLSSLDALGP